MVAPLPLRGPAADPDPVGDRAPEPAGPAVPAAGRGPVGDGAPAASPRGRRPARALRAVGVLGELLLTLGLVLLLFCAYELWFTGLATARAQEHLTRDLTRTWAQEAPLPPAAGAAPPARPAVPLGGAFARLYLPTLRGADPLVVVEGVGVADLQEGPGHLPGSAQPGRPGNLVLSGHRTTYGAPFADLDRLRPGDPVVLETRDAWVTYRVTGAEVVLPTDTAVTLPVPRAPGATPTRSLITLTTCTPRFSAARRLVLRGELAATATSRPALLGG